MRHRIPAFFVCLVIASNPVFAADPAPNGTRTTVPMSPLKKCATAPMSISALSDTYYTRSIEDYRTALNNILSACFITNATRYVVVVHRAAPTKADGKDALVHTVLDYESQKPGSEAPKDIVASALHGVKTASWVYLTDDATDVPRIQLVSTPQEHPLVAQAGGILAAVAPLLGFAAQAKESTAKKPSAVVYFSESEAIRLPYGRGTIAETDFVQSGTGEKVRQIDGSASFNNTPLSRLTVHFGAGVIVADLHGAKQAKVDDGTYVTSPLKRSVTLVAVALHPPFDSSLPTPSKSERFGFAVGAVITPAPGVYIGPTAGWRSFSFSGGYAWMWVATTPEGFSIGSAVKKTQGTAPADELIHRSTGGVVLGGTYTFK